jgi:basic membrane protein A
MHSRKGISTTAGIAIVIFLLAVAAIAYYLVAAGAPSTTTQSTSSAPPVKTSTSAPAKKYTIGVVFDVGGLGDRGFNDLAYQGMMEANKTLGVDYTYEVAATTNDFPSLFNAMIAKNVSLIVGVGFDMDQVINQTAHQYPNRLFAQVDGDIYNVPNIVAIKYQEHIGSAIVGALAVAMTKTDKIAFLGGVSTGIIYKFWNGWKAGAVWASNYLHKNVTLIKQYAGSTFNYFDEPQAGYQDGQSMMAQGADIIFTAAGGTGIGTFNAIGQYDQQQGWNWTKTTAPPVFAIGVDANQDYYGTYQFFVKHSNTTTSYAAPSFILTSEIKKVDLGVFNVMKAVVYGNFSNIWNNPSTYAPSFYNGQTQLCGPNGDAPCHVRGVYLLGLAQGAVGPTGFAFTSQYLTPTAKQAMAQITQGILNGTISIPEDYNDSPA